MKQESDDLRRRVPVDVRGEVGSDNLETSVLKEKGSEHAM
jgi:hypothetical protein